MNNYALTGASYPLIISGKEFAATTLRDIDEEELDGYVRSKILNIARSELDFLSAAERQELLAASIKAAASVGWRSPEGSRIINTTDGILRLGWQLTQKKQPKLDFEEFKRIARSKGDEALTSNLLEIDKVFAILHFEDNSNGDTEEPKEDSSENNKSN